MTKIFVVEPRIGFGRYGPKTVLGFYWNGRYYHDDRGDWRWVYNQLMSDMAIAAWRKGCQTVPWSMQTKQGVEIMQGAHVGVTASMMRYDDGCPDYPETYVDLLDESIAILERPRHAAARITLSPLVVEYLRIEKFPYRLIPYRVRLTGGKVPIKLHDHPVIEFTDPQHALQFRMSTGTV